MIRNASALVRGRVGAQQELALRAAARDQVELVGQHLPWERHALGLNKNSANR
jgi:hypothetical protein